MMKQAVNSYANLREGRRTTLGAAYYRTGRFAEAQKTLTESLALQSDRPAALAFLAMPQKRLGQKESTATFQRLQEAMKKPQAYQSRIERRYLGEARAVVLGLRTYKLDPETWHVVGPFDNPGKDPGLGPEGPPEKGVDLGASYPGKSAPVAWQTVRRNARGYVDLLPAIADSVAVISYAYCEVESPTDQVAEIYFGSDDGARLWVNGAAVYTFATPRTAVLDGDLIRAPLRKGRNAILLKIANVNRDYGFYFRFVTPEELKGGVQ